MPNMRALPAGLLALVGVVLGAFTIEFLATHPDPPVWWRVEILVTVGFAATIAAAAYWLVRSDYGAEDLWVILGWTLTGVAGASLLGGGIYLHQSVEQVTVAEPALLFEFLALVGAGLGLAFGISRRSLIGRRIETALGTAEPTDIEGLWTVVSMLGDDPQGLRQRWELLEHLAGTATGELPVAAFIVQLSGDGFESFPDDEAAVKNLLYDEHLPVLLENGLVAIDDDVGTIRFSGPDAVAAYLKEGRAA